MSQPLQTPALAYDASVATENIMESNTWTAPVQTVQTVRAAPTDCKTECKTECKVQCAKPDPCADPCAKPDPCADPCAKADPCADPCAKKSDWGWLGALILWFIIFTVLFWLIFFSLKPAFVLQNDSNQVDTAKVLLAAVIAALILVIIVWLVKVAIARCK